MNFTKSLLALMMVIGMAFTVVACDGSAENAGERIDEAATDAGNTVEDLCEDAKEGMNAKDTDC
ncbi:hypothetical protein [Alkalimarinus coralli]|uniref:hypothetical protein n=1 Tax=Alkalimarinus coralli TaxID=2935863 RepID=UPI00202AF70E|nr:hypothetical protein [Alkalimarinus coralli]